MSDEDINLTHCMHRLKIAKSKMPKLNRDDNLPLKLNPFARRNKTKVHTSQSTLFGPSCLCRRNRIHKKSLAKFASSKKILREPVIVLHECNEQSDKSDKPKKCSEKSEFGESVTHQDFRSIIAGCEQLSLSTELQTFPNQNFREAQPTAVSRTENRELSSSCSQQAMARLCINPPCDVTIDELACYFETFVHIPKKMSSMAEMMYI